MLPLRQFLLFFLIISFIKTNAQEKSTPLIKEKKRIAFGFWT